jgi:chitodextrinase
MKPVLLLVGLLLLLASPASAAASDRTPPSVPGGLRVVSVTEDSIAIAWNASTDDSGRIQGYVVNGNFQAGAGTTATITGLAPGIAFEFRVVAVDPSGNASAASAPLTATTARDVIAPTAPGNLRVTHVTDRAVALAWDAATDRWPVTYLVLMDGAQVAETSERTFQVNGLALGSTHTFAVRARDFSGNTSAASGAVTATLSSTPDVTPPPVPTGLTARDTHDGCGGNPLAWNPVGGDAIGYEVFLNGRRFAFTPLSHAYFFTAPGTNTWTVRSIDTAHNASAFSNAVTLTIAPFNGDC